MARIKLTDLPVTEVLTREEAKGILGGIGNSTSIQEFIGNSTSIQEFIGNSTSIQEFKLRR